MEAPDSTPDSQLRCKPSVAFPIHELQCITLKASKIARLGVVATPEINIEIKTGKKIVYGVYASDFDKLSQQLRNLYPSLCR
jgi:hypothetical protein